MIFAAVIQCKFEKKLEFNDVITDQDSVICLSNAGNVDIIITGDVDTEVGLLRNSELLVVQDLIEIARIDPTLFYTDFVFDGTHQNLIPLTKCYSVFKSLQNIRQFLILSPIEIKSPS